MIFWSVDLFIYSQLYNRQISPRRQFGAKNTLISTYRWRKNPIFSTNQKIKQKQKKNKSKFQGPGLQSSICMPFIGKIMKVSVKNMFAFLLKNEKFFSNIKFKKLQNLPYLKFLKRKLFWFFDFIRFLFYFFMIFQIFLQVFFDIIFFFIIFL